MNRQLITSLTFCLLFAISSQNTWAQKTLEAYVFLAEECPISIYMTVALKESAETYKDQVDFIAVFPNSRSNYKTMGLFIEKYGLQRYQRILDENQAISKKYGAKVTPEVVIIDSSDQILYRGQISNAYQKVGRRKHGQITNLLSSAIEKHLDGEDIVKPWPNAIGCFITFHNNSF
jgi:thiol-disulfide isomerase/thioredoxin